MHRYGAGGLRNNRGPVVFMKVLHLPTAVGGNSWALAQAEKSLGLESSVMVTRRNWPGYSTDIDLGLQLARTPVGKAVRLLRGVAAIRSRYDVLHFNFGSSLLHYPRWGLNQADLSFYPPQVRLFATYNGCDARQKFPTMARQAIAACHDANCYGGMCNSGKLDEQRRQGIKKMAEHAAHLWALNPDLLHFLPPEKSSFLPYVAAQGDAWSKPRPSKGPLAVVHAPTNRAAKGTEHILRAVERIEFERPGRIRLTLIEGLSHAEALARYREADLAIDQVLIGWYGGFACELMQMGKPVISRIEEQDLHFIPAAMREDVKQTIINAGPDNLHEVLLQCIDDRDFLLDRGKASLEYVHRWHHPDYVAGLTKERYERAAA